MSAAVLISLLLLSTLAGPATGDPTDPTAPDTALREGNRLFTEGDLEAALAAYAAGWAGGEAESDPLLAYNLGTTALHLGRLPEALLWYRRAEAASSAVDPWLRDNLEIVRRSLAPSREAALAWAAVLEGGRWLAVGGVVLAWVTLGLLVLPRPAFRQPAAVVATLSCLAFLAGVALEARGPRAAVLLAACPGTDLTAGSEVWVLEEDGAWRVLGNRGERGERGKRNALCPARAVGLVDP